MYIAPFHYLSGTFFLGRHVYWRLFTIWVEHVFLDTMYIAPLNYLSGTCFLGHHVYCASSLFEWDKYSWAPCILTPFHYLSGTCFFFDTMYIDAFSLFNWDIFSWIPCILRLFTIWVGHAFLDTMYITPFHYLSGTCFLGRHVYCASSQFVWDLFSWTTCILHLFTIWVRHVFLDIMYIAPLHYLCGSCFLGHHVYCAFSLFEWDMFSWTPCILTPFHYLNEHVFLTQFILTPFHDLSGTCFLGHHVYCASSLFEWNMFSWTPCILRLFTICVGNVFLDAMYIAPLHNLCGTCFFSTQCILTPFHYLSGTCFLGYHVYCASSLFVWVMFSWTPCILRHSA